MVLTTSDNFTPQDPSEGFKLVEKTYDRFYTSANKGLNYFKGDNWTFFKFNSVGQRISIYDSTYSSIFVLTYYVSGSAK